MRRSAALIAAGVAAAGLLAAGCGNGGLGYAQQACIHVNRSIALYQRSLANPNPQQAAAEQQQAANQLEQAEPLAAAANSSDGTWNGLMTTIGEVGRVAEAELITSLRSQCQSVAVTANSTTTGPTVPGTTSTTGTGPTVPSNTPTSAPG